MKNIHLIPTDKPSRLHNKNGELGNYPSTKLYIEDFKGNQHNSFHIYIISNEEIKEGDWFVDTIGSEILKADSIPLPYSCKKIILTTDKDLIADGVQAIDDEFLQWFVKNPSCEEVETKLVEFEVDMELGDSCIEYGSYYEIIIPSEEPTAYHYLSCCRSIEECHCGKYPKQIKCYCGHTTMCDCSPKDEPKQETLEEAAKTISDYIKRVSKSANESVGIMKGAKWQQEQDKNKYSEEEVRNLFRKYQYDLAQWVLRMEDDIDGKPIPTEWFEQFKKK